LGTSDPDNKSDTPLRPQFTNSIEKLGFRLEDVLEGERDAGLGNGGLGRLAACYVVRLLLVTDCLMRCKLTEYGQYEGRHGNP
jgi:hypothetical protein